MQLKKISRERNWDSGEPVPCGSPYGRYAARVLHTFLSAYFDLSVRSVYWEQSIRFRPLQTRCPEAGCAMCSTKTGVRL